MEFQTIQTTYYVLGIIFMSLFFVGLLVIVTLVIAILVKINKIQKQINDIVTGVKEHPGEKAAEVLLAIGSKIAENVSKKKD